MADAPVVVLGETKKKRCYLLRKKTVPKTPSIHKIKKKREKELRKRGFLST